MQKSSSFPENELTQTKIKIITPKPPCLSISINKSGSINNQHSDVNVIPFNINLMNFEKVKKIMNIINPPSPIIPIAEIKRPMLFLITSENRYNVSIESLERAPLILGRAKKFLNKNDRNNDQMSNQHCKIQYKDSMFWLSDNKSTNGTFIYLPGGKEIILKKGLELEVSMIIFKVCEINVNELYITTDDKDQYLKFTSENSKFLINSEISIEINNNGKIVLKTPLYKSYQEGYVY